MGCASCGTKSGGGCSPTGCKNNGVCGTSGCNSLNVIDWFSDIDMPLGHETFGIVEVRFGGGRKEYYNNPQKIDLYIGDYVCVESSIGFDIGTISATGEIVRLQVKKKNIQRPANEMPAILRIANENEIERYNVAKSLENATLERARTICLDMRLQMKLSDIDIQGDGRKVIFFYTAEDRVDFRELIRKYADEFKMKIEMRHVSYREEASRLGGIGVCGRTLCCSTWLTDYKVVSTYSIKMQNLSLNMDKLNGQCGRLKCCLNYELDTYVEAVNEFPKHKFTRIETIDGTATSRKTDILKREMWFSYENSQQWVPLHLSKVNEFLELNSRGEKAPSLTDMRTDLDAQRNQAKLEQIESVDMLDVNDMLADDIEFDKPIQRKNNNNNKKRPGNRPFKTNNSGNKEGGENQQNKNKPRTEGEGNNRNRPRPNNRNRNNSNRNNNKGSNE